MGDKAASQEECVCPCLGGQESVIAYELTLRQVVALSFMWPQWQISVAWHTSKWQSSLTKACFPATKTCKWGFLFVFHTTHHPILDQCSSSEQPPRLSEKAQLSSRKTSIAPSLSPQQNAPLSLRVQLVLLVHHKETCCASPSFQGKMKWNLPCRMTLDPWRASCVYILGRRAASPGSYIYFFCRGGGQGVRACLHLRMKMSQEWRKRMWWQVISERGSFTRRATPFYRNPLHARTAPCLRRPCWDGNTKLQEKKMRAHTCTNTEQFHRQQQQEVKAGAGSRVCCEGVHRRYSCGCCRSGFKGGAQFWCGFTEILHHEILHCGFKGRV